MSETQFTNLEQTDRVTHVFERAKAAAEELDHQVVMPEDVLAGILAERDGVAAKVLTNLKIDEKLILDFIRLNSVKTEPSKKAAFDEETRKLLEDAETTARSLGHTYLGTEHLLMALTDGHGVATLALESAGIDRAQVRMGVARILAKSNPEESFSQQRPQSSIVVNALRRDEASTKIEEAIDALKGIETLGLERQLVQLVLIPQLQDIRSALSLETASVEELLVARTQVQAGLSILERATEAFRQHRMDYIVGVLSGASLSIAQAVVF